MDAKENLDEEIAHQVKTMIDEEIKIVDTTSKDYSYLKEYVNEDNEEVEKLVFVDFMDEDKTSSNTRDTKASPLNLS